MKRRIITARGSLFSLPAIPESLIVIVKEPRAKLTPENKTRVSIYEAVLKYQLFGSRPWTWKDANDRPEKRDRIWDRCPTCARVLIQNWAGIVEPCSRCRKDELQISMWGE